MVYGTCISIVLLQSTDHSKLYNTYPIHPFTHTHIHTLMAEAAMQGANCTPVQFGVQYLA